LHKASEVSVKCLDLTPPAPEPTQSPSSNIGRYSLMGDLNLFSVSDNRLQVAISSPTEHSYRGAAKPRSYFLIDLSGATARPRRCVFRSQPCLATQNCDRQDSKIHFASPTVCDQSAVSPASDRVDECATRCGHPARTRRLRHIHAPVHAPRIRRAGKAGG